MAVAYGNRSPRSSSLYDVLDLILDKGLVVDLYVRVSLVGIEILTVDARVVVASVDTYLRFADAVNRLELGGGESSEARGLPEVIGKMGQGAARGKTEGVLAGAGDQVRRAIGGRDGHEDGRRGRGAGFMDTARRVLTSADDTDDGQDEDADDDQEWVDEEDLDDEDQRNQEGDDEDDAVEDEELDDDDQVDARPRGRSVDASRRVPAGRSGTRR